MFGKAKASSAKDQLSERMRRAVERPTAPPPSRHALPAKSSARCARPYSGKARSFWRTAKKLPVALKNISATGARVEYFTRRELPLTVTLVEPTLRIKSRARVVWQGNGVAGLAFTE